MLNHRLKTDFAVRIHQLGIFKDKTKSPEGKGFKLKKHLKNPNAPLSPIYLDFRLLQSEYDAKMMAVRIFYQMLCDTKIQFDRLAAIPEAIVPVVSTLSDQTRIPMITPRVAKDHGSGSKVDGIFKPGMSAPLFDDVVTGADSKIEARDALMKQGLVVNHVFVLADRQQGGAQALSEAGLTLHAAFTLDELLEFFRFHDLLDPFTYQEIVEYLALEAPQV